MTAQVAGDVPLVVEVEQGRRVSQVGHDEVQETAPGVGLLELVGHRFGGLGQQGQPRLRGLGVGPGSAFGQQRAIALEVGEDAAAHVGLHADEVGHDAVGVADEDVRAAG